MATELKTWGHVFTFGMIFRYFSQVDFVQCFEVILISKQLLGKPSGKFIIQAVANRKLLGGATYVDNRYAL